eukprot:8435373-Pyramimonas_sp.AAC.1
MDSSPDKGLSKGSMCMSSPTHHSRSVDCAWAVDPTVQAIANKCFPTEDGSEAAALHGTFSSQGTLQGSEGTLQGSEGTLQ